MSNSLFFSGTDLQALVVPTAASSPEQYQLLTLLDIADMTALNATLGWQHGNAAIDAVSKLLRAQTPDGDVWRRWRGDKFLANLAGSAANEAWVTSLPGGLFRYIKVPVTVCALKVTVPDANDIGTLLEFMTQAKRTERQCAHIFDARD